MVRYVLEFNEVKLQAGGREITAIAVDGKQLSDDSDPATTGELGFCRDVMMEVKKALSKNQVGSIKEDRFQECRCEKCTQASQTATAIMERIAHKAKEDLN